MEPQPPLSFTKTAKRFRLEEEQGKVTTSPLNFSLHVFSITSSMPWIGATREKNIDGEYLSHLIFADDIVLLAHHPKEIEDMLPH